MWNRRAEGDAATSRRAYLQKSMALVDRLAELLEAEAKGHPVNWQEAGRLAIVLRDMSPVIAGTMQRIADRMGRTDQQDAAVA